MLCKIADSKIQTNSIEAVVIVCCASCKEKAKKGRDEGDAGTEGV